MCAPQLYDLELRLKSECEMGNRDVPRRDLKLELPLSNHSTPGMARPNHLNLQGLSHGRPGGGSGRKKMQLTFQGSPSVTLRETIKSPDASEIDAKLQEIMKLTDILTVDGRKYEVKIDDMEHLGELGNGTCGHVVKMRHRLSGKTVAVKQMRRTGNRDENKRIIMDLEVVLKSHDCPYIVTCLGCFIRESDVWICMELMSTCLDKLLKKCRQPIPEDILGKISVATVKALNYLKVEHGVIHRDVKPSNILLDEKGNVKLCDFGISGRLVDSKAKTRNAGCAAYMAPERIDPPDPNRPDYDIRADVWSLGITLVELATGHFPYKDCKSDFEVLSRVLNDDPPSLPPNAGFSAEFQSFVRDCLTKNYEARPKYKRLLEHPFIKKYEVQKVDVASWYASIYRQQDQRQPEKSSASSTRRESASRSSPKKLMSQASSASPKVAPKPASREACEMFTSPSPSGSLSSVATSRASARDASPAPRRKFAVEHSPVPPRRLSRENSPAGPRNFQAFNLGSLLTAPFGNSGGSSNGSSDNTPPSPFVRQNSLTRDSPFYRQASFRSDAGGQFLRQNSLTRGEVNNFTRQGPLRASAGSRGVGTASYMPPPFVRRNSLSPSEAGPKLPPDVPQKYQPTHHAKSGSCNSLGGSGLPPSAPSYVSSRDPSPSSAQRGVAGSGSNFLDTRTIYYPERNLYLVQRSRESLASGARDGQGGTGYNASLPPRSGSAESSHATAAGLASQYVKKGGDKISAWIKQRFPFVSGGNNTGGATNATSNHPGARDRSKINDHHPPMAASATSSSVHNKWYLPSPNARRRMSDTNAVSGGSSPTETPHLLPPFVPTSAAANYQQQHHVSDNQHREAYLRSKYTPEPVRKNFYHY